MANDKDFIVKNAVEVGGPTNVTLGTITSSTVDLSTGNYFSETLAANTTYAFSNAGDVQSFQLEVTGADVTEYYDLANSTYLGYNYDVGSEAESALSDITFNGDGTKMYAIGTDGDKVLQYSLSTPYTLTSVSYDSVSFSVLSQDTFPSGVRFNNDGTKMYIVGYSTDAMYEYDLSTAYDISTASYNSVSFSISGQTSTCRGFDFKPDGTKVYAIEQTGSTVYQYSLSTAWDLSTASYDSVSFSAASQDSDSTGLGFSSDGTKMFIAGIINDSVFQYSLSTPWDVSTASYDNISKNIVAQVANLLGLNIHPNGTYYYGYNGNTDQIFQYSMTSSATATITWPTSIEWAGGMSPAAPATGETDLFTFSTDDGGTSYIGLKTADNLS